jgi:hypothetical protein
MDRHEPPLPLARLLLLLRVYFQGFKEAPPSGLDRGARPYPPSGDQAGSVALVAVGIGRWLNPVMSTETRWEE